MPYMTFSLTDPFSPRFVYVTLGVATTLECLEQPVRSDANIAAVISGVWYFIKWK
jgi:hypothetical protein